MDPFEIRLQFTKMLQKLNASVNASKQCASFALKHKDLDEDLHSCILEQLERSSMNNRVNLLYFIEHFLDASLAKNAPNYITLIQTDFPTIVNSVTPPDESGLQNIGAVRKVILKVRDKGFITPDLYDDLVETLDEREATSNIAKADRRSAANGTTYDETVINGRSSHPPEDEGGYKRTQIQPGKRLDGKAIEQRMEEDRERHKRLRENIWVVGGPDGKDGGYKEEECEFGLEFEMGWHDRYERDLNEDDIEEMAEEAGIKVQSRM